MRASGKSLKATLSPEAYRDYRRGVERRSYEKRLDQIKARRIVNAEANKAYFREYYIANRETKRQRQRDRNQSDDARQRAKEYRQRPEIKAKHCSQVKAYIAANREKVYARQKAWRARTGRVNEYDQRRRDTEPAFRMARYLRNRLNYALKNKSKNGSAVSLLGCTTDELISYLESMFRPGMTWENRRQWHVDHIRPLASFNLEDPQELALACHYSNLQPLWAAENIRKGARRIYG